MEFIKTEIEGLYILQPKIFLDARGYFFESYSKREFDAAIYPVDWVQDNESKSSRGVVRGLHFQLGEFAQAKLVRCVVGEVLDVAVDLRKDSPTYGQHVSVRLSADNHRMFFIPRGFAHGFAVLSEEAVFQYKCDNYYAPASEGGIQAFDEELGIDWGISKEEAIVSEKDRERPPLSELKIVL